MDASYHLLYFGCNSFIDHEYGRLIEAVDRYAPENTYIIFTTNHGEMGGAHSLWGKVPAMYEEITHVLFIIRQPGGKGAGMIIPTPVSHIDILPTTLDLAGLTISPIMEGETLNQFFDGRVNPDREIVVEFNRYEIEQDSWGGFQPVRCIVTGHYELLLNLLYTDGLYSLEDDLSELKNIIEHRDYVQIRDTLQIRLIDWMNKRRDPFRGPAWERRPWSKANHLAWMGKFRPRPAVGYATEVRDYDTGLPTKGVKMEIIY